MNRWLEIVDHNDIAWCGGAITAGKGMATAGNGSVAHKVELKRETLTLTAA